MMTRKLITLSALLVVAASLVSAQAIAPANAPTPGTSVAPMKVGGDVLPPKLTHIVEPKLHLHRSFFHSPKSCKVLVRLTIPVDGVPIDIHVVRSCNATFDKSAMDAVSQYRFEPATLHGKPVPVAINIEVQFKIF